MVSPPQKKKNDDDLYNFPPRFSGSRFAVLGGVFERKCSISQHFQPTNNAPARVFVMPITSCPLPRSICRASTLSIVRSLGKGISHLPTVRFLRLRDVMLRFPYYIINMHGQKLIPAVFFCATHLRKKNHPYIQVEWSNLIPVALLGRSAGANHLDLQISTWVAP